MKLTVWGGLIFVKGKQWRAIIATRTKKRACEILKVSFYEFDGYWTETGNDEELKIALEFPNTIFVKPEYSKEKFIQLDKINVA